MENLGVDGSKVLKCAFKKWDGHGLESVWYRIGTGGGLL